MDKTKKPQTYVEWSFICDLDGSKIKPYFERLDGFESVGGIASLITQINN